MKAKTARQAQKLTEIPNVGPRFAADLHVVGILKPSDLKGKDPFKLYEQLNHKTGLHHDPCVLDTFMAVVDFMNGGKPTAWWKFTARRKKMTAQ